LADELTIAIIGCGKQAAKHLDGFEGESGLSLVLGDQDPKTAEKLARPNGHEWVDDPKILFGDKRIDAVDICTPTPTHAELALKSLESGAHFFCEKPLCQTADQARKIAEQCEKTGLVGMVGYIYRQAPVFQEGKRILSGVASGGASPVLGNIVSSFFRLGGRGSHRAWKHRRSEGGGAINEMLVHLLDLVLWYFGPPQSVELMDSKLLLPRRSIAGESIVADAEDYVMVKFETPSGGQVICQADLVTPSFSQYVEIQGERGSFFGSIQADRPSYVFCQEANETYPQGKSQISPGRRNLYAAQMKNFVDLLRGQTTVGSNSLNESVRIMELIEIIKEQQSEHKPLRH
jgi:UDP-N-acetyl-2-amino-2-deoxyglucuronate dehydrogenase